MNALRTSYGLIFGITLPLALSGCSASGSVRGVISAGEVAVGGCPGLTSLLEHTAIEWAASLHLDVGDSDALRDALTAAREVEQRAEQLDGNLKGACDGLASGLGAQGKRI